MSEDLIKRSDVIEAIHNYWKKRLDTLPTKESECGEVYEDIQQTDKILEHNKTLCNFINAIPSTDRPQEWIPCSERLPEIGQKVLASTKKTVFTQVFKGYHSDPKIWAWENNRVKRIEAWQPLPKPWKGADDE